MAGIHNVWTVPQPSPEWGYVGKITSNHLQCATKLHVTLWSIIQQRSNIPGDAERAYLVEGKGGSGSTCAQFALWRNMNKDAYQVQVGSAVHTLPSSMKQLLDKKFTGVKLSFDGKKGKVSVKADNAYGGSHTWETSVNVSTVLSQDKEDAAVYVGASSDTLKKDHMYNMAMCIMGVSGSVTPKGGSRHDVTFGLMQSTKRRGGSGGNGYHSWVYVTWKSSGFAFHNAKGGSMPMGCDQHHHSSHHHRGDAMRMLQQTSATEEENGKTGENVKVNCKTSNKHTIMFLVAAAIAIVVLSMILVKVCQANSHLGHMDTLGEKAAGGSGVSRT